MLDWELSTLGDPLADFSYHLMAWHMPHSQAGTGSLAGFDLAALGIPTLSDYVDAYVARTGLDPRPYLPVYFAYNFFRLAAIMQGIAGRVRDGTATSAFAAAKAELVTAARRQGLGVRAAGGAMKTFALALGSGGARGLAHIAVIEALDEMGMKPVAIAGTSIGALIGAAYAAGMSGKDIRHHVIGVRPRPARNHERASCRRAPARSRICFSGAFSQATQMDAEKFCAQFLPEAIPDEFSALAIPLMVDGDRSASAGRKRRLPTGPLRPALAASIAFPGLFRPVSMDGRVLIDGGATNPLPFDQLAGRADVVVAVDVFGVPAADRSDMPGAWESMFTTLLIMGSTIVAAKHKHAAPDLVIRPNVGIFRTPRFLSGELDHPRRRGGEGRGEGEARRAAGGVITAAP